MPHEDSEHERIKLDRAEIMLIIAFIQGAKWWEYQHTGATMWPADEEQAEVEARRKLANETLGQIVDLGEESQP